MWDDPKALNALAATLAAVALALIAIGAVAWGARHDAFAIREVVVATPLKRSSPAHLEAAIRADLAGTFFTLDLGAERAGARRHGSATGAPPPVAGTTRGGGRGARAFRALGRRGAGEHRRRGSASPPRSTASCRSSKVPTRARPTSRRATGPGMVAPLGLTLRAVSVSARGGWRLQAASAAAPLSIELGRDEPDAGRGTARFVAAYARTIGALARSGTRVAEVDLRYRNGFAARVPGFREKPARRAE